MLCAGSSDISEAKIECSHIAIPHTVHIADSNVTERYNDVSVCMVSFPFFQRICRGFPGILFMVYIRGAR